MDQQRRLAELPKFKERIDNASDPKQLEQAVRNRDLLQERVDLYNRNGLVKETFDALSSAPKAIWEGLTKE